MSVITDKALLVNLAVSQWTARKLDRKETQELAKRHGSVADAARVNKALLPMAAPLDAIHKKTGELRQYLYTHTLPWAVDGSRILPTVGYMDFTADMRRLLAEWDTLVADFVTQYPTLKAHAQVTLNGMYKPDDYPDVAQVKAKFKASVSFFPVPSENDFRAALSAEEDARLRDELREQLESAQRAAARECWARLYDVVKHAADKLADPKGIFRDSLVENAQEICKLLPKLNLTDDPKLEQMRRTVENSLCAHTPEALRLPGSTREQVADTLRTVANTIERELGGTSAPVSAPTPSPAPTPAPVPVAPKTDAAASLDDILAKMGAFYAQA